MIDRGGEIAISRQTELLSLCRSGVYYTPAPPSERELLIKRLIDEIYTDLPVYGARRIALEMSARYAVEADRKTVAKYMREMGIYAIYPKKNLSKPSPEHKIYPYLLRHVEIVRPNQVWEADTTYIRMLRRFMYLTTIIDVFSRYAVAWILSDTLAIEPVLDVARLALETAVPEIMNTDQGSDFTSPQFTKLFLDAGAQISMDHRGRCFDNIFIERHWRTVKYEYVFLHDFASPKQLRSGLRGFYDHYNNRRFHSAIGYNYPVDVYMGKPKF